MEVYNIDSQNEWKKILDIKNKILTPPLCQIYQEIMKNYQPKTMHYSTGNPGNPFKMNILLSIHLHCYIV